MPGNPDNAFLIKQRTPLPAKSLAVGGFFFGIVVLAGLGSKNPGQQELRPTTEVQPLRPQSWVEQHAETIYRLSTRLLGVCFVMFWVSMVGLFFGVLNSSKTLTTASRPVQADIFGPIGLPLLAGFVFWVGMICALVLYCLWSFTRYQHLRQRLRSPKPPSPFRHPSRLVTILGTEHEQLSEYGRRIKVTGWAFTIASGMFAMVVYFLYTAS